MGSVQQTSGFPFRQMSGLTILLTAVTLLGCKGSKPPQTEKSIEVEVTTPILDTVVDSQDFTGRLESVVTVEIRPRVSGYIDQANFKEGDLVTAGSVLFQIEPSLFRADLDQADANLNLAKAERNLQETNAGRARQMLSTRSISREEYDQIFATREKTGASVEALKAAHKRASVKMGYTKVKTPVSGRISRRYVDPGNLVKEDETLLTTVVDDNEVYASFDVDERTYLDVVKDRLGSKLLSRRLTGMQFPVLMRLANEESYDHVGVVDFIDNRLNASTGTIRMRATFANPQGLFKSGMFVRVRLPIGRPYKTLLIPDEAVQSDQGRKFVFIVDADNKVARRDLTLGQAINSLRVVKEDKAKKENILKITDRVVINGTQRVRPQVEVKAEMKDPPKPPDTPLRKLFEQGTPTPEPSPSPSTSPADSPRRNATR